MADQSTDGSKTMQLQADSSDDDRGKVKRCFIISPIGSLGSDTRRRSDAIRDFVIKPVMEELGYEVLRADDIADPGMIVRQIVDAIVEADIVIADLTSLNPNVLYELAIRHETGKPVIMIAESSTDIPFDINQVRTIFFAHNDLRSVDECKGQIKLQAQACMRNDYQSDNPIVNAKSIKAWKSSGDANVTREVSMTAALQDVSASLSRLDRRLRDIEATLAHERPNLHPGGAEGRNPYLPAPGTQVSFSTLQAQAQAYGIDLESLSLTLYSAALQGDPEAVRYLEALLREVSGEPAPRS